MENITLRSIKNESIKKIFNAITSKEQINRAEISQATGLSLMTVGKVVDALLHIDVITQKKDDKVSAGRKAGIVSINTEKYAVVIDLSERNFVMYIVDIGLHLSDTMTYKYNSEYYYDENLFMFMKNVSAYLDGRRDIDKCIGIGIAIPGIYSEADDSVVSKKITELNSIKIRDTAENLLHRKVSVIMKNVHAAAVSNIRMIESCDSRVIIYMFMGESIDGAVYNRGMFVKGSHGFECDFGSLILRYGKHLEDRISASRSDIEIANELSSAVYNITTILDPDAFIIESDLPRQPDFLVENIKTVLNNEYGLDDEHMPELYASGPALRHCARGIVMELRNKWIDGMID